MNTTTRTTVHYTDNRSFSLGIVFYFKMNILLMIAVFLIDGPKVNLAACSSVMCTCEGKGKEIKCSGLNLNDFPDFSDCVNMTSIDCSSNRITELPDAKKLPPFLVKLDISYNAINHTGTNSLSEAHYLEELNISGNKLTTMLDGSKLPRSLRCLDFSANNLQSFGSFPFRTCIKLVYLDLHNNRLRYNSGIFYKHLFKNVSHLAFLDIGLNSNMIDGQYPDVISNLHDLESLVIDGLSGVSFQKGFTQLKRLKAVTIMNINLKTVGTNYFENLTQITNLTLTCKSHDFMKDATCKNLRSIESGAIAKLHRLRYLDVSNNLFLGFCGLRNITKDLENSSIKILKAKNIQCPYGFSNILFIDDVKPLNKTSLEELYLDKNRIEMAEDLAPTYLPKTLKILSLELNRLRLESYIKDGLGDLTGIRELYLNSQDMLEMIDLPHWWRCNDFQKSMQCMQKRRSISLHEAILLSFDNQLQSTNNLSLESEPSMDEFDYFPLLQGESKNKLDGVTIDPHPEIQPENCTYVNHTFFKTWIPPNIKKVEFTYSGLGDIVMQQFLTEDTLEAVNMSGNHFEYLKGPVCNSTKVKILDFSENKFSNITPYFFVGFESLEELYLQENRIGSKASEFKNGELFKEQKRLKILDMSSNRISLLPVLFLVHNTRIRKLDLRHNMLTDWNMSVSHCKYLKYIDLSHNQIPYISTDGMRKLQSSFEISNVTINLHYNIFTCYDCESLTFFSWIDSHKERFLHYHDYTCQGSDGFSLLLYVELRNIKLSCSSKVSIIIAASSFILLSIGIIIGVSIYRFRWHLRYWYYVAKRQHHKENKFRNGPNDFTFDAFISYADDNRYLLRMLITHFEEKEGMKLCIHHRDFIPGCDIADNISNAIHQSRKTICLMSRAFLKSAWCMYELNISRVEGMWSRGGDNMIIIFQVDDMPMEELPTPIIELLKNETYLEYRLLRHDQNQALDLLKTAINH